MSENPYGIQNFTGEFKIRDDFGEPRVYDAGDVIVFRGKQYIATRRTSGYSPLHGDKGGWKKITLSTGMKFTNSETEPEVPNEGDHWFDSSVGKLFIYLTDKDTSQWIEL